MQFCQSHFVSGPHGPTGLHSVVSVNDIPVKRASEWRTQDTPAAIMHGVVHSVPIIRSVLYLENSGVCRLIQPTPLISRKHLVWISGYRLQQDLISLNFQLKPTLCTFLQWCIHRLETNIFVRKPWKSDYYMYV